MEERIRQAIFEQVEKEPFARKFGLRLVDLKPGYSKVEMVAGKDLENIFGMTHGGALFALIDEAFETACNSHGIMAVALSVTINYIMPPTTGSTLTAVAQEISRTRKTGNYDIKVHDGENRLIASCQALAYRKGSPPPFLEKVIDKKTD